MEIIKSTCASIILCVFLNSRGIVGFDEAENDLFEGYNKNKLPSTKNNKPTIVSFDIYIKSIYDISEKRSSFKVRYYLNLLWIDSRLKFAPFVENNKTINEIHMPIDYATDNGRW